MKYSFSCGFNGWDVLESCQAAERGLINLLPQRPLAGQLSSHIDSRSGRPGDPGRIDIVQA